MKVYFLLVLCCFSLKAVQIIPSTNRCDWTVCGVPGGIPNYTIFTNVVGIDNTGASDVSTVVQALLNSCPAGQSVRLGNGSFLFNTSIHCPLNVELSGQGSNTVIRAATGVVFDLKQYCGGYLTVSLYSNANAGDFMVPLAAVPSASTLGVGCMVCISETNDWYVTPNGWEDQCGPYLCTYCDNGTTANSSRVRGHYCLVTNIVNSTNIYFTPPLASAYSIGNQAAQLEYWSLGGGNTNNMCVWAGYRGLHFDNRTNLNNNNSSVKLYLAACCWVTNCWFDVTNDETAAVFIQESVNCEVRHSYFIGYSSRCGGVNIYVNNGLCRVEDNIFDIFHFSVFDSGRGSDNLVFGNTTPRWTNSTTAFISEQGHHGANPDFIDWEENAMWGIDLDSIHGSASRVNIYRNWIRGSPTNGTFSMRTVQVDSTNYWCHVVGNLLWATDTGASWIAGYGATYGYEYKYTSTPSGVLCTGHNDVDQSPNKIRHFVYSISGNNNHATDSYVESSAIRHANYSYISNAVEYAAGYDHSPDISLAYPGTVIVNRTDSNGKPNYWGDRPWPGFDFNSPSTSLNAYTNIPSGYRYFYGIDPPASGGGGGTTIGNISINGVQMSGVSIPPQ